MKTVLFLIGLLLAPTMAFAGDTAPYLPEVDARFKTIEALPASQSYTGTGISNFRLLRAVYDVTSAGGTLGAHPLGVSLPAKALITKSWFYIDSIFPSDTSSKVALSCEDANNIFSSAFIGSSVAGTGAKVTGIAGGLVHQMVGNIAAACEVTATVATSNATTGKLTLWLEYVVTE